MLFKHGADEQILELLATEENQTAKDALQAVRQARENLKKKTEHFSKDQKEEK